MNGSQLATLDWNLVQAFLAVVDHGSMARAAQATGLSQPTLGRQIAALEDRLQAALLTRGPRGSQLTETGERLIEPARQMQAAAQTFRRAASGQSQTLAGTVRISASEAVCAHFLPGALSTLRDRHPEVQFELVANNMQDDLLDRQADIAVRMVQPTQDTVLARSLGAVPMGAWADAAYLARRLPGSAWRHDPSALRALDWIGEDRGDYILRGMAQRNPGMTRERFAIRSDHDATRWQAVVQGLGVGFALDALAARHPGVVRVLPRAWVPPLPLWLTAAQELRRNARFRLVFDHLADTLPALLATSPADDGPAYALPAGGQGGSGSVDAAAREPS